MYDFSWHRTLLGPVLQRLLHRHLATSFAIWREQAIIEDAFKNVGVSAARKLMALRLGSLLQEWQVLCIACIAYFLSGHGPL